MTEENYNYLIYRELKGDISQKEKQQLDQWLSASEKHQVQRQEIVDALDAFDSQTPDFSVDLDADFARIKTRMHQSGAKVRSLPSRRRWLSIAAAVLALAVAGWWSLTNTTPDIEWLELATGPQQQQTISLADGSSITLNENTRLRYPASFDGDNRPVELEGEAFFDVAKNPDKPFIIATPNANVEVLGTSFNVHSRPSSAIDAVTVVSGRVAFSSLTTQDKVVLTAGQSASLNNNNGKITRDTVPSPAAISWKTGRLNFVNTPLTSVFTTLEQYFDVSIENKNPDLKHCYYSFRPSKKDIDAIFKTLERVYSIEVVKDKDNHYVISGGGC